MTVIRLYFTRAQLQNSEPCRYLSSYLSLWLYFISNLLLQTVSILAISYPYYFFFVKLPPGSIMSSGGPTSTILPPPKTPKYCISEMYRDDDLTTAPHDSQNFSLASPTQSHHLLRSRLHLGALQLGSTSLGAGCRVVVLAVAR